MFGRTIYTEVSEGDEPEFLGISVTHEIPEDDPEGWLPVTVIRPSLMEGEEHGGPSYRLSDDETSVEAVYEAVSIQETPRAIATTSTALSDAVSAAEAAKNFKELRGAFLTFLNSFQDV
jgi:hypothetical protein